MVLYVVRYNIVPEQVDKYNKWIDKYVHYTYKVPDVIEFRGYRTIASSQGHIVGTYDGTTGTAVLYINGQPEQSSTSLGSAIDWDPVPYNCLLGRYDDDNESYGFQGKIDDVAV